jgi:hypothetical protein
MSLVIPIESSEAEAVTATCRHPRKIAERLAADFAQTAIERDRKGGTAKRERDLLRQSGLLSLLVPNELGGNGSDWPEIRGIVRNFARVDGSLAHLFGFQHLLLATIELFGSNEQRNFYFQETARNRSSNWRSPASSRRVPASLWTCADTKGAASASRARSTRMRCRITVWTPSRRTRNSACLSKATWEFGQALRVQKSPLRRNFYFAFRTFVGI